MLMNIEHSYFMHLLCCAACLCLNFVSSKIYTLQAAKSRHHASDFRFFLAAGQLQQPPGRHSLVSCQYAVPICNVAGCKERWQACIYVIRWTSPTSPSSAVAKHCTQRTTAIMLMWHQPDYLVHAQLVKAGQLLRGLLMLQRLQ